MPAAGVTELVVSHRADAICVRSGATSPLMIRPQPIAFYCASMKECRSFRGFRALVPLGATSEKGLRMLVEGNYLILYEFDVRRDEVEIVGIVDGHRELSGLF
ncbi:hypothetical protein [Reyranella sp.]|uniref:hypothetical protein n=1 Tax=Reyranella sp. TaxID=1929291 RepID=UPI003D0D1E3D